MAAIIPLLAAAGLAAYLFTSGGAKAESVSPGPPSVPPEVLARMAKAIGTNDPKAIRAEATKLLAEGWQMQAQELYRVANEIEAGRAKAVPVKPPKRPAAAAPPKPVLPAAAAASPHTVAPKADVRIVSPLDTVADPTPGARMLSSGMTGADVLTWQRQLAAFGYSVPGNGRFDAPTVTATKRFQADSIETYRDPRIKVDGKVGPDTRKLVVGRANAKGMRLVTPVQTKPGQAPIAAPAQQAQANAAQATAANALKFGSPTVAPVPVVLAPAPSTALKPAAMADAGGSPLDRVADPTPSARVLKKGVADGPDVKGWQAQLKAFGYPLGTFGPNHDGVDGNFGNASDTATRKFQADGLALYRDKRIVVDGAVGPTTRKLVVLRKAGVQPVVAGDELGRDGAIALADTPLPGLIAPAVDTTPIDPARLLAGRVAAMLIEAPAGREDRTLIGRFQSQEGVKATGLYGPGTAIALVRFGIAPPWPRAWSKKNRTATRSRYREVLLAEAAKDPARADEWQGAALERL